MTTKHVFTTPYGGREIWRDGKPFAILAKPTGAPVDNAYYVQLSAFGHLTAATPDLLEALGDAIAMLEVYATGKTNSTTHGQAVSTIRDARKAIAKATGKAV